MPSGLVEPVKCFLFIVVPLGETQLQSGIYYTLFNFFIWKASLCAVLAINFVIMMKCILIILIISFDCELIRIVYLCQLYLLENSSVKSLSDAEYSKLTSV